jgi:predicted nucleic acid-binding protein
LFGLGIGWIDAHLLASAQLTPSTLLWTRDRRLRRAAETIGLAAPLD